MSDFQERFVDALRRRLYPNTNLHLKQLPAAIGRSESAVSNWRRGRHRIAAEDLVTLARYFAARGDRTFLREIFPKTLLGPPTDSDPGELVPLLRAVLAALPQNVGGDFLLWVTDEGAVVPAPLGHAAFVSQNLSLPAAVGDLFRYATGILGWIAVSIRPKGVLAIHHDGRRVAPLAAESLCDWLRRQRVETRRVRRSIHIDGDWLETEYDSVDLAIEAIEGVAFIVRKPRRPWTVNRLPLDSITDDRLKRLLQIHAETPDCFIEQAAAMGAFTDCSICSVEGDNVNSLYVARKFLLSRQIVEGQNIMALSDTDYALMVRSRMRTVKREEQPIYWELSGTLNDEDLHYLNLALPEPGPHGKVLTSSVVVHREIL